MFRHKVKPADDKLSQCEDVKRRRVLSITEWADREEPDLLEE